MSNPRLRARHEVVVRPPVYDPILRSITASTSMLQGASRAASKQPVVGRRPSTTSAERRGGIHAGARSGARRVALLHTHVHTVVSMRYLVEIATTCRIFGARAQRHATARPPRATLR